MRDRLSLPFLHIVEVVAQSAKERGFEKVLILGTRFTMTSDYYPRGLNKSGVAHAMPKDDEIAEVDRIIWDDLLFNRPKPESIAYYVDVIERSKADGCQAVVLGCTEIPLMINDENSPLPTLDSTRLLAQAALTAATEQD